MAPADVDLEAMLTLEPLGDSQHARSLSAELKGLGVSVDLARPRPEPPAPAAGALRPRPPDAAPLGYAPVGVTSATGLTDTPQLANAINARA